MSLNELYNSIMPRKHERKQDFSMLLIDKTKTWVVLRQMQQQDFQKTQTQRKDFVN